MSYTAPQPVQVIPVPTWFANPAPVAPTQPVAATPTQSSSPHHAYKLCDEVACGGTLDTSTTLLTLSIDHPTSPVSDNTFSLTSSSGGSPTTVPTTGPEAMLTPVLISMAPSDQVFFLHTVFVPADVYADLTLPPW